MTDQSTSEMSTKDLPLELLQKRDRLIRLITGFESCAVAFSAGVDSTVVAKAAQLALDSRAVAITGRSHSLAEGELEQAVELAAMIGIAHQIVDTEEFDNEAYRRNASDRCFHCKSELYEKLLSIAPRLGYHTILNGANLDDRGDHRPGMQAARDFEVRSPLLECELGKQEVRLLAAHWELPVWDKPAAPCLSSRVAYGEEVTPQRLAMIDAAERCLKELGLGPLRVRYHKGDLARIEVPLEVLPRLVEPDTRSRLIEHFATLGFRFVTLDLEGFRSGSLNGLVPADQLRLL
jgi:uncharacterized protein